MDPAHQPLVEHRFSNILALDFSLIGDLVMLSPALRRLRETYPGSRLTLVGQPIAWELFRAGNLIDEVVVWDKRGTDRGLSGLLRLARRLRQKHYDAAFIFHRSFGSALVAYLARIPVRVGYCHELRDFMLTHRVKQPELPEHLTRENLHLLDEVGIPGEETPVEVDVDRAFEDDFLKRMKHRLDVNGRPIVLVCPLGGWPTKSWRPQLINRLLDRFAVHDATFAIVGAPGEEQYASDIYSVNNEVVNLVGRTTLRELVYLVQRADVVVSPDTSVVHLANAVGTPVVALFGPTAAERCGPSPGTQASVIYGKVNCLKCYLKKCNKEPFCMDTITPEEVKAEVDRYLARKPIPGNAE